MKVSILAIISLSATLACGQGLLDWDQTGGNDNCGVASANSCIILGGDDTLAQGQRFKTGNACEDDTHAFQAKNTQGGQSACTISARLDACCVDAITRRCENRSTKKTTPLGIADTQNGVTFGAGCAPGAFVQAEIRLV